MLSLTSALDSSLFFLEVSESIQQENTFTTLIDRFTNVVRCSAHGYKVTNLQKVSECSINKATKLPTSAFDLAVRMAMIPTDLACVRSFIEFLSENGQNFAIKGYCLYISAQLYRTEQSMSTKNQFGFQKYFVYVTIYAMIIAITS